MRRGGVNEGNQRAFRSRTRMLVDEPDTASPQVIQRGRTISVCDVTVEATDGTTVARALVTYKIG